MDNNELLMIVLAFVVGYMASNMMKSMCDGRLVEGNLFGDAVHDVGNWAHESEYHLEEFGKHPIRQGMEHPGDVLSGALMVVPGVGAGTGAAIKGAQALASSLAERRLAAMTTQQLAERGLFRGIGGEILKIGG